MVMTHESMNVPAVVLKQGAAHTHCFDKGQLVIVESVSKTEVVTLYACVGEGSDVQYLLPSELAFLTEVDNTQTDSED